MALGGAASQGAVDTPGAVETPPQPLQPLQAGVQRRGAKLAQGLRHGVAAWGCGLGVRPCEAAEAAGSMAAAYEVEGDGEGGAAADNQQDRLELVAGLELSGEGGRVAIAGRAKVSGRGEEGSRRGAALIHACVGRLAATSPREAAAVSEPHTPSLEAGQAQRTATAPRSLPYSRA